MEAPAAEAARHAAEIERRQEERPTHRLALLIVVVRLAVGRMEADGSENPVTVPELRGEHTNGPHRAIRPHLTLHEHPVGIARVDVPVEVDPPLVDLGQCPDELANVRGHQPRRVSTEPRVVHVGLDQARQLDGVVHDGHGVEPCDPFAHRRVEHEPRVRIRLQMDPVRGTRQQRLSGLGGSLSEGCDQLDDRPGTQGPGVLVAAHEIEHLDRLGPRKAVVVEQLAERLPHPQGVRERDLGRARRHEHGADRRRRGIRSMRADAERGRAGQDGDGGRPGRYDR